MKKTLQSPTSPTSGIHVPFTSSLSFLGTCLLCFLAPSAFAVSMSGDISISGGARFNKGSLMRAADIRGWTSPRVASDSGGFATFAPSGSAVTMATPWFFGASTPSSVLWSACGFTFDLTSSTVVLRSRKSLTVSGVGMISGDGFDATVGDWTFTYSRGKKHRSGFVFSFSAVPSVGSPLPVTTPPPTGGPPPPVAPPPPTAHVPDNGSTLVLLGFALLGLLGLQSKQNSLAIKCRKPDRTCGIVL